MFQISLDFFFHVSPGQRRFAKNFFQIRPDFAGFRPTKMSNATRYTTVNSIPGVCTGVPRPHPRGTSKEETVSKLRSAIEAVAFAAILAGLDEAGTINVSEVFGLSGDEGALVTGILALVLGYVRTWAKEQEEKAEANA